MRIRARSVLLGLLLLIVVLVIGAISAVGWQIVLGPKMPYMTFRHLTDEDLASIIVYLRTIPPVKNAVPITKLVAPLNILVKTMPKPLTSPEERPTRVFVSGTVHLDESRGEYLV